LIVQFVRVVVGMLMKPIYCSVIYVMLASIPIALNRHWKKYLLVDGNVNGMIFSSNIFIVKFRLYLLDKTEK